MHLLDQYSLASSSKIDIPSITPVYYPITLDRYITIHTTSKDSKTYDYWQEVIDILFPVLKDNNIGIVQIGTSNEKRLNKTYTILGQTSVNQVAYILQHAELHLGVDSFPVHIAGYLDKKIVALYSNNFLQNVKPYWGSPENQILLEPDRKGDKPSFSLQENPKTINQINPETIALSVLKLLGIKYEYPYQTINIGQSYHLRIIESIPDGVVNISNLGIDSLILRLDLCNNEVHLVNQLKHCRCSLITDKPINKDILKKFKERIIEVVYFVKPNYNIDFLNTLKDIKIPFRMVSFLPQEQLNKYKIDFIELGLIICKDQVMPDFKGNDLERIYYKSSKFVLAHGLIFPTIYDYASNRPIPTFEPQFKQLKIDNSNLLWQDKDCCLFAIKN